MSVDAERAVWELMSDLGIAHPHQRDLIERLEGDFSATQGGYRSLRAITDEKQRAVASDQLLQSAIAVRQNLIEARLHQGELEGIVGQNGLRFPEREKLNATLIQDARLDMSITGCVRALGSALDCLAAVAVGVLRIPSSIQHASFTRSLDDAAASKNLALATSRQQTSWAGAIQIRDSHRAKPPAGWLDWLLGMRNLNVHRARQVHILLQRTRGAEPQLVILTGDPDEVSRRTARFDLHLRKRPGLPDMYDFITSSTAGDLWINEPATTTLPGMVGAVNELVEEMSHLLYAWWLYAAKWPADFPPPAVKWGLPKAHDSFDGVAPNATPFPLNIGRMGPLQYERLQLANRLR